ncbi:hypothetical protein [Rubritalea marina]|nr:hypothetical protein [Rubritalea marina]
MSRISPVVSSALKMSRHGVAIIKQSSNDYFDAYNLNAFDAIIEHLSK